LAGSCSAAPRACSLRWANAVQAYEDGSRLGGDPKVSASFRERARYLRETYLGGAKPAPAKPAGKKTGK
jgi:hypothetical protein